MAKALAAVPLPPSTVFVVDATPADLRGTAFGMYNLLTGVALLVASVLAGWLWTVFSPAATFIAGGAFAGVALLGMLSWQTERK